jgi:hypothetical protein
MTILVDILLHSRRVWACVWHVQRDRVAGRGLMSRVSLAPCELQAPTGDRFNTFDAEGRVGFEKGDANDDSGFGKVRNSWQSLPHGRSHGVRCFCPAVCIQSDLTARISHCWYCGYTGIGSVHLLVCGQTGVFGRDPHFGLLRPVVCKLLVQVRRAITPE